MTKLFVALIASCVAASCASVRTNVAVSHSLPANQTAKTVAILPYDGMAPAPGFAANAAKLAAQLRAKGYDVVEPSGGRAPDYIAFFTYRIDGGTPLNRGASVAHPVTGSIITYGYRSTYSPATDRLYKRTLTVEIFDRARFQPTVGTSFASSRVYAGSVTSEGSCSTMEAVIDPMLMALFQDFPGDTGQLRTTDIPADAACGLERFG